MFLRNVGSDAFEIGKSMIMSIQLNLLRYLYEKYAFFFTVESTVQTVIGMKDQW